jgi:hypothetical protein
MRGVTEMDSTFERIAELLPQAATEMEAAAERLQRREVAEALPPEQRALQQLLRAEALYRDVQVQMGQQQGAGGGGGNPAEDLADLFELEMDKIRNQYETVQRSQQEQSQREVDEAMERLRELAQRQQQEAERQRQAASQSGQEAQQGGGGAQRRLADETEEAARRLERLARENSSPRLQDAARQLREAANEMRQSAAQNGGRGAAQANAARQKLEEARRRLERDRAASVTRAAEDAERQARELREQQTRIERDVAGLGTNPTADEVQRLNERKTALEQGVGELENRLDRASAAAGANRDAARQLGETAAGLRDSRVRDKIRASRNALQNRSREYSRALEEQISRDLERAQAQLEGARSAAGTAQQAQDGSQQALERARALARAAEAMSERARGAASESAGAGAAAGSNELRQLQSEARQRAGEIDRLRRELRGQGIDAEELASAAEGMRRAQDGRFSSDPEELERLLRSVARGLEDVEYDLRQRIEGREREKLFIASPGQVPPKYRRAVEEYYRSLARDRR